MPITERIDVARVDVDDEYGVTLTVRDAHPGGVEVQLHLSPDQAVALAAELIARSVEAAGMLAEMIADAGRQPAPAGFDVDQPVGRSKFWRASE